MTKHVPLNVLDLVSISEGQTTKEAIEQALEAAQLVDKLGFKRLWFAEHHNSISLASLPVRKVR